VIDHDFGNLPEVQAGLRASNNGLVQLSE
jgi:hypothetical protein